MESNASESKRPSQTAELKKSGVLILFSLINMFAGAVTASVALVGLEMLWPNPISYSLLLVLLLGFTAMIGQYAGTFRESYHGAYLAAAASSACYSMTYLAIIIRQVVSTDYAQPFSNSGPMEFQSFAWPTIVVVSLVSIWLNGSRAVKLKKRNEQIERPNRLSISLREVLGFSFLLGLIILPASFQAQANQSMYRANVTASEAPFPVPDTAEAIQFQRDRNGLILGSYEITEEELRKWHSEQDWDMASDRPSEQEIIVGPVEVSPPDPTQTPFLVPYKTHRVMHGFQVYLRTEALIHCITYDRAAGIAYYEEIAVPKEE